MVSPKEARVSESFFSIPSTVVAVSEMMIGRAKSVCPMIIPSIVYKRLYSPKGPRLEIKAYKISPTTTVGMAKSVSKSNLRTLRNGNSKNPKTNPKGKPIRRLKKIESVELLTVIIMAETVSGSSFKSKKNASLSPCKIKSKRSTPLYISNKKRYDFINMQIRHIKFS